MAGIPSECSRDWNAAAHTLVTISTTLPPIVWGTTSTGSWLSILPGSPLPLETNNSVPLSRSAFSIGSCTRHRGSMAEPHMLAALPPPRSSTIDRTIAWPSSPLVAAHPLYEPTAR